MRGTMQASWHPQCYWFHDNHSCSGKHPSSFVTTFFSIAWRAPYGTKLGRWGTFEIKIKGQIMYLSIHSIYMWNLYHSNHIYTFRTTCSWTLIDTYISLSLSPLPNLHLSHEISQGHRPADASFSLSLAPSVCAHACTCVYKRIKSAIWCLGLSLYLAYLWGKGGHENKMHMLGLRTLAIWYNVWSKNMKGAT